MQYIHYANKIVHRKFKPANILVDDNGLAMFCDFGLVKLNDKSGMEKEAGHRGGTEASEAQYGKI